MKLIVIFFTIVNFGKNLINIKPIDDSDYSNFHNHKFFTKLNSFMPISLAVRGVCNTDFAPITITIICIHFNSNHHK